MKTNCLYCGSENPKHGMKTCSRKCTDELKKINSREKRICLYCKNEFDVRKKEEKKICSKECRKKWSELPENIENRINASKKSVKEKFGVDNIFQLKSVKDKSKKTKLEKYGDENYNNSQKMYQTNIESRGKDYINDIIKIREEKFMTEHGVKHHLQLSEFLDKQKKTTLDRYGVENVSQLQEFKDKRTNTMVDRFGVENVSQNEDIKKQKKSTSLKNFGVEHHLKDHEMFQKHQKARFKIKTYKDTNLVYNGSYEKYFLEILEEKELLNEVQGGQSFEYEYKGEIHTYHTDFFFRNKHIEVKSSWTYDNDGKNEELRKTNETKWESVRSKGQNIVVLIGKDEIRGFVKGI